ncbi:MAG TPA: hypothetical protein VK281_10085, partial [Xanthobacteraceae bacterium]|nr:hypothetical protein [Xanthobacteraceae bacterium]
MSEAQELIDQLRADGSGEAEMLRRLNALADTREALELVLLFHSADYWAARDGPRSPARPRRQRACCATTSARYWSGPHERVVGELPFLVANGGAVDRR